jgi:hypothetical protein
MLSRGEKANKTAQLPYEKLGKGELFVFVLENLRKSGIMGQRG